MWEMMGYNVTYRLSTIALILCRGVPIALGQFAVSGVLYSSMCPITPQSIPLGSDPPPPTGCDQELWNQEPAAGYALQISVFIGLNL